MSDDLDTAMAYHARGLVADAAQIYERLLAADAQDVNALSFLGVAKLQLGEPKQAAELMCRAVALNPGAASLHANLAEAYRALGDLNRAVACCRTALRLQPDYPEAANNLGLALLAMGQTESAIAQFRAAIDMQPDFALAHSNLGNALRTQGDTTQALAHFRKAVQIDPLLAEAQSNLGQLLLEESQVSEALVHCREAVRLRPDLAEAQNNLGNALREAGQLVDAKACYAEALHLDPDLAVTYSNMGRTLYDEGLCDEAMACYRASLAIAPDLAEAHNGLGWVLHEEGHYDEAAACYRKAIELQPTLAAAHCNLGTVLEETNDFAGAERSFREALRHNPRHAGAHGSLATLLRDRLPDADLAALRDLLADPGLSDDRRVPLLFGLAHVLDSRGAFAEAAEHLRRANCLALAQRRLRGKDYEPAVHTRFVSQMIATCSEPFFERTWGFGLDTDRPVFVVGLPRSGTTLVEQILASHPNVFGAGELRQGRHDFEGLAAPVDEAAAFEALGRLDSQAVREIAERHLNELRQRNEPALRVVDKLPDNYLYLGLLATLFPRAKFIHCRRDLRDVAVSCLMTNFRQIRWSDDWDHIALRFQDYRRIMEHWRRVLPVPLLEVSYEETVADLESVARRLVAWCGLEWEPACLDFHKGARPVRTASVTQVRQPIYTTSVARWKHYQETLGPLFARLDLISGPE